MTEKDFALIAEALAAARRNASISEPDVMRGINRAAEFVTDWLEDAYPRFDRNRFLKAVGLEVV